MIYGLRFVQSMDGSLEGINDAGIETFAGNRLASLAREQAQNSLDARRPAAEGPVEVEYKALGLPRVELPGEKELAGALESSISYWSEKVRHHKKTIQILQKAKRILARDEIKFLRISDRNTTGLRDSDKVQQGDWFSLTKASGVSLKGDDALGSYGIGKNVFWLNSVLRTVYFATHDLDGKHAFQGVTKLVSHPMGNGEEKTKGLTRSIGFFGELEGYLPIRSKSGIPPFFRVKDVGTDIFLAGFESDQDWQHRLIEAFAENFFVAFHQDLLRVRIEEHEISSATIAPIIEGLYRGDKDRFEHIYDYFNCLASPDAREFEEILPHIGRVKLRLTLRDGASKQIAMFRATGMMIYEQGRFRTPLEFAGVCICDDPDGNRFLRRLEPPSHDAWEPERYEENTGAAKEAMNALKSWLRKCVQSLYPENDAASMDVPDMERYLPDEEEEEPLDTPPAEAEGDPVPKDVRKLEGKIKRPKPPGSIGPGDTGAGDDEGEVGGEKDNETEGGDRGSKGGAGADETEISVSLRVFMDPASDSRYLIHGELPDAGRYAVYLYA